MDSIFHLESLFQKNLVNDSEIIYAWNLPKNHKECSTFDELQAKTVGDNGSIDPMHIHLSFEKGNIMIVPYIPRFNSFRPNFLGSDVYFNDYSRIDKDSQFRGYLYRYNKWSIYHPIIRASLLHGELVKIHPFIDGNSRTSRLVMNLSLMKDGYLPIIIKKENKLDYYKALDKAHTTCDYNDFINLVIDLECEMLNNYLQAL